MNDYITHAFIPDPISSLKFMGLEEWKIHYDFSNVSRWFVVELDVLEWKLKTDQNFSYQLFNAQLARLARLQSTCQVIMTRPEEHLLRFYISNELSAFYVRAIFGEPFYRVSSNITYCYAPRDEEDDPITKRGRELNRQIDQWISKNKDDRDIIQHPYHGGSSSIDRQICSEQVWNTHNTKSIEELKKKFQQKVNDFTEQVHGDKPQWQVYRDCYINLDVMDQEENIESLKKKD